MLGYEKFQVNVNFAWDVKNNKKPNTKKNDNSIYCL